MHSISTRPKPRIMPRVHLEVRSDLSTPRQILVVMAGLFVGIFISALYLRLLGVGWSDLLQEFVVLIFSSTRNVQAVLSFAAPLFLVGLSAAIGFKARFWNIGIEGQIIFGAIAATIVATYDVGPDATRLVLMILAAAIGGMVWMSLPLFLRVKYQVNEIISTLLLNYVAFNFLLHLLYGAWKDPQTGFPNSKIFDASERLHDIPALGVNSSVLIAIGFILVAFWLLTFSRFGFLVRFVNANPTMARAVGISGVVMIAAALIAGALSGVAGFVITSGIDSRLTQSFFVGYGFSGILIGFLARNNPLAVVLFALLIATLMVAGQTLQVFYQIPFAVVQLIQATIVICVATSEFFIRHRIRLLR